MASPSELQGKRIGRYTLASHLASGGMAELFIARQEGMGGFQKELVLKTLQARYADHERVVSMFLDEARLAASLSHPNIVHVYDVGVEEGLHYIAMEYLRGQTVADLVRRGIEVGRPLPIEHAVHIISQAADGLAYAHARRGADGNPLRIVHRDISPSNLLVSVEGQTKILDFGIARAADQIREEEGMRPGKVAYMAPEQIKGDPVDHRADIFSLGIVLYEITLGRRLWKGPPEVVMGRILDEKIPPPTYHKRDYPPALELIVLKALEKRPQDRYQSAGDLHRELDDFLAEAGLRSGNRRIATYLAGIYAPETPVSADDAARAREFAGEGKGRDKEPEVSDLDFDRRPPSRVGSPPVPRAMEGDATRDRSSAAGPSLAGPVSPMTAAASAGTRMPTPAFGASTTARHQGGGSGWMVALLVVVAGVAAAALLALK